MRGINMMLVALFLSSGYSSTCALANNDADKKRETLFSNGRVALPNANLDAFNGDFKYSFSTELNSETMWRGISLTNHRPGALVRGEIAKGWFYAGGEALNVTLPTFPVAQLDVYGGVRPQFGPVTLDFGLFYYGRPGNKNQWFLGGTYPVMTLWTPGAFPTTPLNQSFLEFFGKSTWTINDYLTIGS